MDANSPYNPDIMRARRDVLTAQRDAILAVSNPIRDARDALVQSGIGDRRPLDQQLKDAEVGLGDIQNELAFLNTSLGGINVVATNN